MKYAREKAEIVRILRDLLRTNEYDGDALFYNVEVSNRPEDGNPRHFAMTEDDDVHASITRIVVSPKILKLCKDQIDGILLHELGHVADFQWVFNCKLSNDPEIRADQIALKLTGIKIRYGKKDLIQTTRKRGTIKRPRGLK